MNKNKPLIWLLAAWLYSTTALGAFSGSFDKAMALYQAKAFEQAYQAFLSLAEVGDYGAMFNLGVMHYRGESVAQDSVKAYAWFDTVATSVDEKRYRDTASKILASLSDEEQERARQLAVQLKEDYSSEAIAGRIFPESLNDGEVRPGPVGIRFESPKFPRRALNSGLMGRVLVEFTISKEGYTRDVIVKEATPEFIPSAVDAARKFLYQPPLKDGAPFYHYGYPAVIKFILAGDPKINTRELKKEVGELKRKAEAGDTVAQYLYASRLNILRSFKKYLKDWDLQYKEANKWYMASAKRGLPHAQFELGRRMIQGRGCKANEPAGMKWVSAAAVGEHAPAQHYLAQNLMDGAAGESSNRSALVWLRHATASNYYPSKLLLAWELSTSPDQSVRDGAEAMKLMKGKPEIYFDTVRILETQAAAYAETGKFSRAVKAQKKALKEAEKLGWIIPVMQDRLDAYAAKQPWRGRYYL